MVAFFLELKKFKNLLGKKNFIFFLLIIVFNFLLSIFEFLGISIIPVYFSLIFQNEFAMNDIFFFSQLKAFIISFNYLDNNIINLSLLLILIFFIKTILSFSMLSIQSFVFEKIINDLFKKLSKSYLNKDYNFFLNMNTSSIINNLSVELIKFKDLMSDIVIIFKELLLLLLLIVCFFFVDNSFFFSLIFLVLIFIFLSLKTKNLGLKGKEVIEKRSFFQKTLIENFSLIALIKQFKIEDFVVDLFANKLKKIERINRKAEILTHLPKVIYEFSAVTFLVCVILFLNYKTDNIDQVLTNIVILSIFFIRFIPMFKSMNKSFYQFKFKKALINEFTKNIDTQNFEIKQNDNNNKIKNYNINSIEFKNINFSYNKKNAILKNINFNVSKGDFVGIIGVSGSGKTSLINLLSGLLSEDNGQILINGQSLNNPKDFLLHHSSQIPQNTFLIDDTIKKNILLDMYTIKLDEKIKKQYAMTLEDLNLNHILRELPDRDETYVGENGKNLSGGQRQRIALARSIVRNKQLIIMDETFSGLDEKNENQILKVLKEKFNDRIIILISHRKNSLKYCNKIFEIKDKEIKII